MISFVKNLGIPHYPEVTNYASLPTPSAVTGMTYIVLQESGTWILGTLKRAGLYYSDGSTWTRLGNAQNFFYDDKFAIKNATDVNKTLQVNLSALSGSTTRTWTIKDSDGIPFIENVSGLNEVAVSEYIGNVTHVNTMQKILDHSFSAGVMHGCDITLNGNGTVSFTSGYGAIRPTADSHSTLYMMEIPAQNNLALIDNSVNYIYIDYNGGSPVFNTTSSITGFNCQDKCIAYQAVRSGNNVAYIDLREQNVDSNMKMRRLFLDFARFLPTQTGSILSSNGGLTVAVSAGAFYQMLIKLSHPAFDTNIAGTANENVFRLYYRNGTGGWTELIEQKTINSGVYDNNTGTPVAIGNNKYGITWFYILNNSPSKLIGVMGQQEYNQLSDTTVATPPDVLPTSIQGLGVLIGAVIYQKDATTFANILNAKTTAFTSSTPVVHNDLGGIQGGAIDDYYHMTLAQYTVATQSASATVSGYVNTTTQAFAGEKTFNSKLTTLSTLNTGAPTGGTAMPWKLGTYRTDGISLSLNVDNYVEVEINGVLRKLAVLT